MRITFFLSPMIRRLPAKRRDFFNYELPHILRAWPGRLDDPASRKQLDDQHNQRKHQQEVNETTERIRCDQP